MSYQVTGKGVAVQPLQAEAGLAKFALNVGFAHSVGMADDENFVFVPVLCPCVPLHQPDSRKRIDVEIKHATRL